MNRVADVINSGFRNTLSKKGMDILTQGLHLEGISLSFFPYFTYFLFLLIFIFIVLFFFFFLFLKTGFDTPARTSRETNRRINVY